MTVDAYLHIVISVYNLAVPTARFSANQYGWRSAMILASVLIPK